MSYEQLILYFIHYHLGVSNAELAELAGHSERSVRHWVSGKHRPIMSTFYKLYRSCRSRKALLLSEAAYVDENTSCAWCSPAAHDNYDWAIFLFKGDERWMLVYEYHGEIAHVEEEQIDPDLAPFYTREDHFSDLARRALQTLDELVEYVA